MSAEQRIRGILFYLSVGAFFAGLPFILSFALGYKFDARKLKFMKAGIIMLRTQPSGASVWLNGRPENEKTPMTIDELMPGNYNLEVRLEKHYPWSAAVAVEPGRVSRLDKIILFPLRPNTKQINRFQFSAFWLDKEANEIYYLSLDRKSIYRSNLEGGQLERVGDFLEIKPSPKKWLVSEDREKLLYFNRQQIAVVYLNKAFQDSPPREAFVIDYPRAQVLDVFWHSNSYHLIVATDRGIEAREARPQGHSVNLVNLNKPKAFSYYDARTDTLYFVDTERASDGNVYDNLYTLQLNNKLFSFQELMRLAPGFEKTKLKTGPKDEER